MGEKWWPNGAWDMHPGFYYMPQICDMGPIILLPFRRKACWGFFLSPFKNLTASAGFEPVNLGTKGQHATSAPPKPRMLTTSQKNSTNIRYSPWGCNRVHEAVEIKRFLAFQRMMKGMRSFWNVWKHPVTHHLTKKQRFSITSLWWPENLNPMLIFRFFSFVSQDAVYCFVGEQMVPSNMLLPYSFFKR